MQKEDSKSKDEMRQLSALSQSKGWQGALYDYLKTMKDYAEMGDERRADWINFLPIEKGILALVIGCQWGNLAVALSMIYQKVYVMDDNLSRLSFLKIRKN